jgi:uncharacterized RDD family membrane protein YckC
MSAASRRARAAAVHGRRAGYLSRVLADGIDFLVVGILLFGSLVTFAAVRYLIDGEFEMPHFRAVFSAVAYPVIAMLYLAVFWTATGRSVGKEMLGLRVVRDDGSPLGILRAALRAVICVTFAFVSLIWVVFSKRNAAVHDLVLRTSVVHDWTPAREPQSVSIAIPEGEPV